MKKKLAILMSILMLSTMMTACGSKDTGDTASDDTTTTTTTAEETTEAEEEETTVADETTEAEEEETTAYVLPEGTVAEDGDAYLAFGDSQWWLQYGGEDMEPLSYGAQVAHIDGEGTYTVSLDASNEDAVGMNGVDSIGGCSFCAIVIKNGETLFPNQEYAITVDSIVVDGTEVELTSKNYNNYEDGNLRSNIFNSYVTEAPTEGVWTADGDISGISAQVVPASTFDNFSTLEITFTVSATGSASDGGDSDSEETSADDSSDEESSAEETSADDSSAEETTEAE